MQLTSQNCLYINLTDYWVRNSNFGFSGPLDSVYCTSSVKKHLFHSVSRVAATSSQFKATSLPSSSWLNSLGRSALQVFGFMPKALTRLVRAGFKVDVFYWLVLFKKNYICLIDFTQFLSDFTGAFAPIKEMTYNACYRTSQFAWFVDPPFLIVWLWLIRSCG